MSKEQKVQDVPEQNIVTARKEDIAAVKALCTTPYCIE